MRKKALFQKKKQSKKIKIQGGVVHLVLSVLVALVLVARAFRGDWFAVFLCALTLVLFNLPFLFEKTFHVELPRPLEIIVLLFIFAAEILGEIGSFYTYISWWDTMLHTVNGFLMAAIGFAFIDILNDSPRFYFDLSPVFVALVAFCFSMTVGIVWEFFEFGMDCITLTDMQKDAVVTSFSSVTLNEQGLNDPVKVQNILRTVIEYDHHGAVKQQVIEGGYLDIGIRDTMKDLLVNCIGAVVFSTIGYFYLIGRNRGTFLAGFIPQLKSKDGVQTRNGEEHGE